MILDNKYICTKTRIFVSFDLSRFHQSWIFITARAELKIRNLHRGFLSISCVFPHGYSHFFQVPTESGAVVSEWPIKIIDHSFQQIKRLFYVGNLGALLVFDGTPFICDSNSQFLNTATNQELWTKSWRKKEYEYANNTNDLENCNFLCNTNSCSVYRTVSSSGFCGMYLHFDDQSSMLHIKH